MMTPRLALEQKGPFEIPPYKTWLIAATGPSLEQAKSYVNDPSVGILAVNAAVTVLDRVDVAILGHYENVFMAAHRFPQVGQIYISDPCDVGFRCMRASGKNLFDLDFWAAKYPFKIRFFEKEYDLEKSKTRPDCLFAGSGISTTALSLLWRNQVKECFVFGVDGGTDHHPGFSEPYKALKEANRARNVTYDGGKLDFERTADSLGIGIGAVHGL